MTDQEYADLKNRARAILKMLEDFPSWEFMEEAHKREKYLSGDYMLGSAMWAAYLEGCC